MPILKPRNRVQIIRDMVARVVARSELVGLTRNSAVFHVIAGAANEDAEQYFQIARLRELFSIDSATGSDLDARAAEIQPGFIARRLPLSSSGNVVFSRPGTTGTVAIASGTIVAATDAQGQIKFRTTASSSILAGFTDSPAVNVVAVEAGLRGNVPAAAIIQFVSRIAGVTTVTNAAAFTNGRDRESDGNFRARLKAFVQAISRGTPTALEAFANNVILADGRRVLFSQLVEPVIPDGTVELFIDDGTGSIEEFSSVFVGSPETILASALGGEVEVFTTEKPIRDDGSLIVKRNAVVLVRDTDFFFNAAAGQIRFSDILFPTGLTISDTITAEYRFYTGLIQETQRIVDGDPATPLTRPGVRPAGTIVFVKSPAVVFQSVTAQITVLSDFDPTVVAVNVTSAIQDYINSLDISEDVIVSEIIERSMAVEGMFDFVITTLTGSTPPTNQTLLANQVARVISAAISLT